MLYSCSININTNKDNKNKDKINAKNYMKNFNMF